MVRGDVFDYSATGREITRVGKSATSSDWTGGPVAPFGAAYTLSNMVDRLAAESTSRQPEFRSFAEELNGSSGDPPLEGNRHFWTSDYMVHRRQGYLTSVKMFSERTLNSELVNGEGLKSAHLSDGVNFIYRRGDEYRDIFPAWDWTLLPGTTTLHASLPNGRPRTDETVSIGQRGRAKFVGGVSDGRYGAAAMDLERGPLTAHKAWFFFDRFYVALGAGITLAPGADPAEVATDINQARGRGDIFVNGKKLSGDLPARTYRDGSLHFVIHDGIGYIPGPDTIAVLSDSIQSGRWSEIGSGASERVSMPVFNLWISHGSTPKNTRYQYTVLPDATEAQTMAEYRHPSFDVLSNTDAIQAIYIAALKYAAVVFYAAASLETPLGTVSVDHPAMVLIQSFGDGLHLTASNPENTALTLHVKINGMVFMIDLPSGDRAGSSITQVVPVPS
jgi:chondroitin AC lyase